MPRHRCTRAGMPENDATDHDAACDLSVTMDHQEKTTDQQEQANRQSTVLPSRRWSGEKRPPCGRAHSHAAEVEEGVSNDRYLSFAKPVQGGGGDKAMQRALLHSLVVLVPIVGEYL